MIIVTGGAGFIGSCLIRALNEKGIEDIVIVDNIASSEKWKNIRNKKYITYINKSEFLTKLSDYKQAEMVIHMGACSSTTEGDFDYLWNNNVSYTKALWNFCSDNGIRFIFASSAATYGDGKFGFDDRMNIDILMPMNGYGYSKQVFDLWVKHQAEKKPVQYVGLKFFNVYGPNEYYKGSMASMVYHGFNQIKNDGEIKLFKSYNAEYSDGAQLRDFVYVKDICSVVMWLLDNKHVNGLYNVGTGRAQSFKELAEAIFHAMGLSPRISYIEMPDNLKSRYQYYTQADISKIMEAGYGRAFMDLETGVRDYVTEFLDKEFLNY